ncbi:Sod2 [Scenedesmus sp. PABB004]|nr:Sod2 [Scenedesmus sp. PABB004]
MATQAGVIGLARFLGRAGAPCAGGAAAAFSTAGGVAAYKLPELPYAYAALEPVISGQIMELHHAKHHAAYVANLNKALEEYADAEAKHDLQQMIALQPAINFNGGGHINHDIFWTNLAPEKDAAPLSGPLLDAVKAQWGSQEAFVSTFSAKTAAVQGSGWGWLGYNKASGALEIATCANQDPLAAKGLVPLLGIDVWEHAYYLQYKNVRPDYLKAIWRVVNWDNVAARYAAAKGAIEAQHPPSPPGYASLGGAPMLSGSPERSSSSRSARRPHASCCAALMMWWRLIDCFRSSQEQQQAVQAARPRPAPEPRLGHYVAPAVSPSPRAGSLSSCDDDQDYERGTLLPKRHTPEPGARPGASTSAAAVVATAAGGAVAAAAAAAHEADAAAQEAPRHRRTGSDSSRGKPHAEGVRARVLPGGGAKGGKGGTIAASEYAAVAELLGVDGDDEDFCPTCLEPYTDDNPKIFTRCGHNFHMQCIYAWLERKSTCPLCESAMDLQDDILL